MSKTDKIKKGRYGSQTSEERRARYHDEWLDGKRVVACFIDEQNEKRWFDYYTGAEASCIRKGVALYDYKHKRYYKIRQLFFTIDASELYIYVEPYGQEELEIMWIKFNLKQGPEWVPKKQKKEHQPKSKSDKLFYNLYC